MKMYDIITKKQSGRELTEEEIEFFVNGVADGSIPDYQISAFLMAVWFRGMTEDETVILTECMVDSGEIDKLAPELAYEPRRALDGGEDGYDFYHAITKRADELLNDGGFILYEVGAGMAKTVSEIGEKYGYSAEIYPDLSGIERAVLLKK
jgi:hypothetical protein